MRDAKEITIIGDTGTRSKQLNTRNKYLKTKINSRGRKRDPAPYLEQTAQSKPVPVDIGDMVRWQ